MHHVQVHPVDGTRAPVMDAEEVVLQVQPDIDLYVGDEKVERGLVAKLTNFHLFLLGADGECPPRSLHLRLVEAVEESGGFLFHSPKVTLNMHDASILRLSFKNGGCSAFAAHLSRAVSRRTWMSVEADRRVGTAPATAAAAAAAAPGPRGVGIAGIVQRQAARREEAAAVADAAFADIDALMEKARDVVRLCERYAAQQASAASSAGAGDGEVTSMLRDVGIASPVTRQAAGALYHQELARQVAAFLLPLLRRRGAGGMISATDAYCRYNRARGTDLVSPDDLLQACRLFAGLRLPLRLHAFPSGVLVIQTTDHDEAAVVSRVRELVRRHGHATPARAAAQFGVGLAVATEYMEIAERALAVCRDDAADGLRFFPNLFVEGS